MIIATAAMTTTIAIGVATASFRPGPRAAATPRGPDGDINRKSLAIRGIGRGAYWRISPLGAGKDEYAGRPDPARRRTVARPVVLIAPR